MIGYNAEILVGVAKEAMMEKIRSDLEQELHKQIQPAIDNVVQGLLNEIDVQAYLERVMIGFGQTNLMVKVDGIRGSKV